MATQHSDAASAISEAKKVLGQVEAKKKSSKKSKEVKVENVVINTATASTAVVDFEAECMKLVQKVEQLNTQLSKSVEMDLKFQDYIDHPPVPTKDHLYNQACQNDHITVTSWAKQWLEQFKANHTKYNFDKNGAMNEFGKNAMKPCIIAGSGPSLKKNIEILSEKKEDVCLVSCLHNFAYFTDNGVKAEYYVNLDSGDITIGEMSQGGSHGADYYWKKTKDCTLITATTAHPEVLKRWKGKILFYSVIPPDQTYVMEVRKITTFNTVFNVGGNCLGACLYFAKAILGSNPIAYIGADFSFGYNKKFHPFDSPYDEKYTGLIPATDVFGNRVYTWQSYYNFKSWFDYQAMGGKGNNPGIYINCTEGGTLGAYPNGNIRHIQQWSLGEFLFAYNSYRLMPEIIEDKNAYNFLF